MNNKFDAYLSMVDAYTKQHPEQRLGQVFFNVLYIMHPKVADQFIRATANDPFHNDDVIPVFLIQVHDILTGGDEDGS